MRWKLWDHTFNFATLMFGINVSVSINLMGYKFGWEKQLKILRE